MFRFTNERSQSYIIYYISATGIFRTPRKCIVTPDDEENDLVSWIPWELCADEGVQCIRPPFPSLLQPVMASILALDVHSIGNESEKVLWFNLPCLSLPSLFLSVKRSIHPSLYFVIFSLLPPQRLPLLSLSYADFFHLALPLFNLSLFLVFSLPLSISLSLPPSLSLTLSQHPPPPLILVAQQLLELRDYD